MISNQSGAVKDNRLLFREQWVPLFSKSKMALFNLSQSRAELRIQDGGAYESEVMLENSPIASTEDWDRSRGFSWRHKSCQGHKMSSKNRFTTEVRPASGHD